MQSQTSPAAGEAFKGKLAAPQEGGAALFVLGTLAATRVAASVGREDPGSVVVGEARVDVHVTRRKHVRPSKGGPGRVHVHHSDTMRVVRRDACAAGRTGSPTV